jgi:hypothetical protein
MHAWCSPSSLPKLFCIPARLTVGPSLPPLCPFSPYVLCIIPHISPAPASGSIPSSPPPSVNVSVLQVGYRLSPFGAYLITPDPQTYALYSHLLTELNK